VTYDSLNRHMLGPYGCDWVHTSSFDRLAERAVTYEKCYIGSTISMPARRELHTGRYNFLHRDWGPLEPFDDSMPEILSNNDVYTHLITDHYHYWEDGGATYHTRYNSFEFARGQEWDPWKGRVARPEIPPVIGERPGRKWWQAWVNREHIAKEEDYPQAMTFTWASEFLRTNRDEDQWFLHVETFDPHEPFQAPERFRALYPHEYHGPHFRSGGTCTV
jgi:arylsulfatase A-like enzyme